MWQKIRLKRQISSKLLWQDGFPACTAAWRTEKQDGWRRKWLQNSPTAQETRQQEDKWTDRTDSRSRVGQRGCEDHKTEGGEEGWEGEEGGEGESFHITDTQDFSLRRRDWGIETAPYSRSSSSYNSLYLPLLNLKEKTGIWKNGDLFFVLFFFSMDTWQKKERKKERKGERGKEY